MVKDVSAAGSQLGCEREVLIYEAFVEEQWTRRSTPASDARVLLHPPSKNSPPRLSQNNAFSGAAKSLSLFHSSVLPR
jgi:hypothetical protein